jgi:hypothetical protein
MSDNRAVPETEIDAVEEYEPPEVSDYGRLVDLTLSGSSAALSDAAGFNVASAAGGS